MLRFTDKAMVQNDGFRPMSDRIYVVGISAVEMDY
jgi:hypothetical protein